MKPTHDVLVGIATYNEMENLPRLVHEIFLLVPHVDLLVVDDHSPDGTGIWCDQRRRHDPRIHCLHRPSKMGLGTATIAAMQYAIDHGYRLLINLDADFSHPPRYLPELLSRMDAPGGEPPDVVIGSRYVAGGAIRGWPRYRRWISRLVNVGSRWLLGLQPHDCSGSFRCYRTAKLRELEWGAFRSQGYSIYEELIWRLQQCGATMAELPIEFVDRESGQTKVNFLEAIRAMGVLAVLGLKWRLGLDRIPSEISAKR